MAPREKQLNLSKLISRQVLLPNVRDSENHTNPLGSPKVVRNFGFFPTQNRDVVVSRKKRTSTYKCRDFWKAFIPLKNQGKTANLGLLVLIFIFNSPAEKKLPGYNFFSQFQ